MFEIGQRLDGRVVHAIVKGVAYSYERRRYTRKTTFTWVYRWDRDHWFYAGDPWPSIIVPKKDLERLAADQPAVDK